MPELPDVVVYVDRLGDLIERKRLEKIRLASPFVLRSVIPAIKEVEQKEVLTLRRLGKRIVIGLGNEIFLVIHLMIAGQLHWRGVEARIPFKSGLAAFDFSSGTLLLTEAGSKKRASLHLVRGEEALAQHNPGGFEVLESDYEMFRERLAREDHTLKRAFTDPRILSGLETPTRMRFFMLLASPH